MDTKYKNVLIHFANSIMEIINTSKEKNAGVIKAISNLVNLIREQTNIPNYCIVSVLLNIIKLLIELFSSFCEIQKIIGHISFLTTLCKNIEQPIVTDVVHNQIPIAIVQPTLEMSERVQVQTQETTRMLLMHMVTHATPAEPVVEEHVTPTEPVVTPLMQIKTQTLPPRFMKDKYLMSKPPRLMQAVARTKPSKRFKILIIGEIHAQSIHRILLSKITGNSTVVVPDTPEFIGEVIHSLYRNSEIYIKVEERKYKDENFRIDFNFASSLCDQYLYSILSKKQYDLIVVCNTLFDSMKMSPHQYKEIVRSVMITIHSLQPDAEVNYVTTPWFVGKSVHHRSPFAHKLEFLRECLPEYCEIFNYTVRANARYFENSRYITPTLIPLGQNVSDISANGINLLMNEYNLACNLIIDGLKKYPRFDKKLLQRLCEFHVSRDKQK